MGDSFYVGNALENESIDAAKGLMDLHKVDSHGSSISSHLLLLTQSRRDVKLRGGELFS